MKDKVLRNTIKANITISAALSMTLMLSLILVCFKSVSDVTYNTRIKEACMLAIESAFSAYHNDMVDEYDADVIIWETVERYMETFLNENLLTK